MARPNTKLVCTIGPASADRARELVDVGMSVARINFSHGSPESQKEAVHAVRAAAHHARRSVAVMIDLPGPKIRLGELPGGDQELDAGAPYELITNRASLAREMRPGDRILLADGAVELVVLPHAEEQSSEGAAADGVDAARHAADVAPADAPAADVAASPAGTDPIHAQVVRGGLIRSRAGVNIPIERLSDEALTAEDRAAIPRALELRADLIAQSFVRSAADVDALRALLPQPSPRLVAKIETRAAVDAFDDILKAADGVMVARGDLGVDMPYEELPLVQKDLIRRAHAAGRFTIVATQMLESMTASQRPTRAEASDVANAVLDGADAVMLSAETAIGQYPIEAARTMLAICAATEKGAPTLPLARSAAPPTDDAEAVCRAAVGLADGDPSVVAIWCFTRTGRTAEMLSLLRPRVPVLAFTINAIAARRVAVRSSVVPLVMPADRRGEALVDQMRSVAGAQGVLPATLPATVLLVTTSTQPTGINRLELHELR